MEASEESSVSKSVSDGINDSNETQELDNEKLETVENPKSNGVGDSTITEENGFNDDVASSLLTVGENIMPESDNNSNAIGKESSLVNSESIPCLNNDETLPVTNSLPVQEDSHTKVEITRTVITTEVCVRDEIHIKRGTVEVDGLELPNEKVSFETEILVEKDENYTNDKDLIKTEANVSNNILDDDIGQNIELSDVLSSADVEGNVENNNCTVRQEVFNKEELLDILEGNEPSENSLPLELPRPKDIESQLALQQLSRLQKNRKISKKWNEKISRASRRSKGDKKKVQSKKKASELKQVITNYINEENKVTNKSDFEEKAGPESDVQEESSIVNVLVKDWDDEEVSEIQQSKEVLADSENLSQQVVQSPLTVVEKEVIVDSSATQTVEEQNESMIKNVDDNLPRRLGRVIKKKVIFDPDNPDTFTKGKPKNKDQTDKGQTSKKGKTELSNAQRSKSPVGKLQWKKPTPKNSKQNKRLTEIDKLLMDEGAVNMIYQLTPEAPKGKKNMRTKAEFIKKAQSSTPDGKEMKFRERKKESGKSEDGEPKRILAGKHRTSLSSSVKSPSVCEDFETHSADDSIIYRRHSSSSYSSTCMSPRRLSDVDNTATQKPTVSQKEVSDSQNVTFEDVTDVFMSDVVNNSEVSNETIKKDDGLSIKEKLKSRLSRVLNKRKSDSKADKPLKQRKVLKRESENADEFKCLSIGFDNRLVEICIQKTGSKYSIETLKELERALLYVDSKKEIAVTLLTSECGSLCSDLDFHSLLDPKLEQRTNSAYEIAETVRSLLCVLSQHSKLLCVGVWGSCWGVSLGMLALSDVMLAGESAMFSLGTNAPLLPGLTAFTAGPNPLPRALINNLVIFNRRLSAAEAMQAGLVSRTLLPENCLEHMRAIVKDIASQPPYSIMLKKQLLSLKKSECEATLMSCLAAERDLLAEYWLSMEGQEAIRSFLAENS